MNTEAWLGLIRHVLTTAGGVLASKGVIESGQIETIVGALVVLIGVGWSVWAKRAPSA